jgi:hypothetical protein
MKSRAVVRDMATYMRRVNPRLAAAMIGAVVWGRTCLPACLPSCLPASQAALPQRICLFSLCSSLLTPADERDEVMVQSLSQLQGRVVGVVGLAHLDGIERRWEDDLIVVLTGNLRAEEGATGLSPRFLDFLRYFEVAALTGETRRGA